jgi:hypothetical protein
MLLAVFSEQSGVGSANDLTAATGVCWFPGAELALSTAWSVYVVQILARFCQQFSVTCVRPPCMFNAITG